MPVDRRRLTVGASSFGDAAAIGDAMNAESSGGSDLGTGAHASGSLFPTDANATVPLASLANSARKVVLASFASYEVPLHQTMRDLFVEVTTNKTPSAARTVYQKTLAEGAKYLYDEGFLLAAEQALKASM